MDTRIMIRDGGPYGPGLSLPAAIARLCDGEQVTVTPVDAKYARRRPALSAAAVDGFL